MSYQLREIITINNIRYETQSEPLKDYEDRIEQEYHSKDSTTCLWRGYVGTWEVELGRLFLEKLQIPSNSKDVIVKEVSFEPIFKTEERVFAQWFSGPVIVPKGRVIMSYFYEDIYEINSHYIFQNGILVDHYDEDNTLKEWKEMPF